MERRSFCSTLIAAMVACALSAAADAADPALQGKKVLFVTQTQSKERASDEQMRKLLESRGLVVTVAGLPAGSVEQFKQGVAMGWGIPGPGALATRDAEYGGVEQAVMFSPAFRSASELARLG